MTNRLLLAGGGVPPEPPEPPPGPTPPAFAPPDRLSFPITLTDPPTEPTAGMKLWLDAADEATLTTEPVDHTFSFVERWLDKSGNDVHLSASRTKSPAYGSRTINGLGCLDFSQSFLKSEISFTANNQPNTIFIIVDVDNTSSDSFIIDSTDGSRNTVFFTSSNTVSMWSGAYLNGPTGEVAGKHIYTCVFNADNSELYRDGAIIAGGTMETQALGGFLYIGSRFSEDYFLDGAIGEIVVYPGAISGSDQRQVEGYLASKWDVSGDFDEYSGELPTIAVSPLLWYDASDSESISIDTVQKTGDAVTQWNDKSGNNRHAVQANPLLGFLTGVDEQNSLNALTGSNVDERMTVPTSGLSGIPFTYFAVVKSESSQTTVLLSDGGLSGVLTMGSDLRGNDSGFQNGSNYLASLYACCNTGVLFPGNYSSDETVQLTARFSTVGDCRLRANGVELQSNGSPGDSTPGSFVIGRNWKGILCELLVYANISDEDRGQVEAYLINKWGTNSDPWVAAWWVERDSWTDGQQVTEWLGHNGLTINTLGNASAVQYSPTGFTRERTPWITFPAGETGQTDSFSEIAMPYTIVLAGAFNGGILITLGEGMVFTNNGGGLYLNDQVGGISLGNASLVIATINNADSIDIAVYSKAQNDTTVGYNSDTYNPTATLTSINGPVMLSDLSSNEQNYIFFGIIAGSTNGWNNNDIITTLRERYLGDVEPT